MVEMVKTNRFICDLIVGFLIFMKIEKILLSLKNLKNVFLKKFRKILKCLKFDYKNL